MKEIRAEEIIGRKIREEEANSGLLEDRDALWSALDRRLEKNTRTPKRRYYTVLAAASVVFLLVMELCLYPEHKTGEVQPLMVVQPAIKEQAVSLPEEPLVKDGVKKAEPAIRKQQAVAGRIGKSKKTSTGRKELTQASGEEVNDDHDASSAGLYAMPQIACAEVLADPLCSQTL